MTPALVDMRPSVLTFAVLDEPSRTRRDAAGTARRVLDACLWARAAMDEGSHPTTSIRDGDAVHTIRCDGPGWLSIERVDRGDADTLFRISPFGSGTNGPIVSLRATVGWEEPDRRTFAAALDLLEAATRAVLDPAPGDEVVLDLRAVAVHVLQDPSSGFHAAATAAVPWDAGVVCSSNGLDSATSTIDDPIAMSVGCVDTFSGPTVTVDRLTVHVRTEEIPPVERLRLLARHAARTQRREQRTSVIPIDPEHEAKTTMTLPTLDQMADRAASITGADRILDGLVFKTMHDGEGHEWSDQVGDDYVWYRRDPEDRCAFDAPPTVSGSVDLAMGTLVQGMELQDMGLGHPDDRDPKRPWSATVRVLVLDEVFTEKAATAAGAVLAASLRAHARVLGG